MEENNNKIEDTTNIETEENTVTREINLDDLYDGAVNSTVVIDPITNNEVLLDTKKRNYTFIGIFLAILALLTLYYVYNKTEFGNTTKQVKPKQTTKVQITTSINETGKLSCVYNSKSEAETQNINYTLEYEAGKLTKSTFNFVVVSNTDTSSAVIDDLQNQYEQFFITNAATKANRVTFEKNNLGFTFNVDTNYKIEGYDSLTIVEGQTILFVKPSIDDTIESLQDKYTEKGFTCQINTGEVDE